MCEKGVNLDQLKLSIGQADDSAAVVQHMLEQLHHLADHGGQSTASAHIAQAGVLLGEARGRLERAIGDLEGGADSGVSVERI
ncbi:MAG: hypothetical protein C0418_04855, partial [Coriobacteriaceae bacterium]|nr:hypothetical protein [Coriobacteriaceae bacterium]